MKIYKNEYIFNKDYCECVLSNNKHVKIDIEDYDLLKNFGWYDNGIGYVRTGITLNGNFKRFSTVFIFFSISVKYRSNSRRKFACARII